MTTRTFPAQFEYLDAIRDFAAEAARQAGMDEKEIYNVQLAVDEAASNVIEHAYEGIPDGQIEITLTVRRDTLSIVMCDQGRPFDPNIVAEPDINAALEDREIGGLGLFFMHKLMSEVRFEHSPEKGNILTMIKRRAVSPVSQPKKKATLTDLFDMGEKLLAASTFAAQNDIILETAHRFVDAEIFLWLDEKLFRLPDWKENVFAGEAPLNGMKRAVETGQIIHELLEEPFLVAIPLKHEDTNLGALCFRRPAEKFRKRELDFMTGIARTASLALLAWHRIGVERWRLGQLNLFRTVNAQIANQSDIDELAHRVTRLIQGTFRYYYVAMFTLERGAAMLNFRSSVGGGNRRKGRPTAPALQVELGQGLIGFAALTGEEIHSNDVKSEPRYRHIDSLPETLSEVVLPLKIEERVVGVLDIQSDQKNAFHPYDLLVLRALADSIAVAIEGANLYGDLQRRADQLRVVAEVSKQITTILTLRELMQEVARLIQERFNYPYVHLFTVHLNRRQIQYQAGSGARSAALEGYTLSLDDDEGIVSWVARNGQTVLANDVDREPRYLPSPLPPANTRSELTVPLMVGGIVYGVMDVQSDQLDAFTEDDRMLFETLADGIAAAIRNADLYRSEQWRRQVGDSLREVAGLLSANASLEHVLDAILTELERNLPADISAIWLLDENDIHLAGAHGINPAEIERARLENPQAAAMLTMGLLSRQPVIRKPDETFGPAGIAGRFNPDYSSIAAPLRVGDQAVGVLTLSHHTPGRYGHEAQTMVTTFASYAAVAIENARLYDSAQEQAYASAALLQVAQAVVSLSDLEEILGTIVRIMPILVGVERAAIYTWDAEAELLIPAQSYGIPEDIAPLVWRNLQPDEFPMLAAALAWGQPAVCEEAHRGPESWMEIYPCAPEEVEAATYSEERLLIALPLMVKGEIFGVMLAEEASGGRRFRTRRLEILTGIAQQVALAIQNNLFQIDMVARERLDTEIQLARQIQMTFMPEKLPHRPYWDLSARWRTARQVGGDFYDVFELPNGRIGLFIADVADKGVPAALFMALTRTLIRAAVLQTDSPAAALKHVNELLYPDCQQGMFVTAVYAVLDSITGQVIYANAGHNPPLFIHKKGLDRLTRTGMALGVVENIQMEERSFKIGAGTGLLFYTDGVTEAFAPDGAMFGEERLYDLLNSKKWKSAHAVLDALDAALNSFLSTNPPSDDITLIAVWRTR